MSTTEWAAGPARPGLRSWALLLALCGLQALLILLIQLGLFGAHAEPAAVGLRIGVMAVLRSFLLYLLLLWGLQTLAWPRRLLPLAGLAAVDALLVHALSQGLGSGVQLDPQALRLSAAQLRWISHGGSWAVALAQYLLFSLAWQAYWQGRQRAALEQQARAAQLQALQNQLNPHFLFNAMNTVRALIFEDRDRAAELLTELSILLRASLELPGGLCSLAEEWRLCRRYLALESGRLEERLRLDVHLPDDLMDRALPRFALLGLCENAIKHGIGRRRDGGLLQLQAEALPDGGWQLRLSNPLGPAGEAAAGLGSGLRNLAQSLRLQLGPGAELQAGPGEDGRYHVRLTLPGPLTPGRRP